MSKLEVPCAKVVRTGSFIVLHMRKRGTTIVRARGGGAPGMMGSKRDD